MSNTVITKEKQSLKALRKENGMDNKAPDFAEASRGRPDFAEASTFTKVRVDKSTGRPDFAKASTGRLDFVGIQIHGGRIVISDYSENNDRNPILAILGAIGLETKVQTESWCG
jgi:hypothetical protein